MGAVWPLTGRVEELRTIGAMLADCRNPAGGVAIAGRPGVGKSRLAREAVAAASTLGWEVRWVVGTATARSIPLGSFAQWTDGIEGNPLRLVRQVISAMTTSAVPEQRVLVAVDDAHLLDDLSAFVLHQLVLRRLATVIATIRSSEAAPDAVTALWKDGHLRRMELQALSRAESDALVTSALDGPASPECCERLWRFTRGNVLFLRQLLEQELDAGRFVKRRGEWRWSGRVTVSPSLMDLVELQVGALSDPVREIVDLVAVAEPVERVYLASLVSSEVIEEAESRGLISVSSPSTDLVRVGHPLYAEVRLAQSGPLRLRRLKGRVAKAMRDSDPARLADPLRLGLLWLESDLVPDGDVFLRAAQAAIARLDLELAERLADAAIRAGAGPDAAVLRAHSLILLSRGDDAEQVLASINETDLPAPTQSSVLHLRAANLLWPLARPDESWAVIEQAMTHRATRLNDQVNAFRCIQLAMAARPAEVSALMSSVDRSRLTALEALVAIWAEVIALGELGCPEKAAAVADEGYALACESPYAAFHGVQLTEFHVGAMLSGGCVQQALAAAKSTSLKCAKVPGVSRSVARAIAGMAALGAGDLATAVQCLRDAIDELTDGADSTGSLHRFTIAYTEALARSGEVEAARRAHAQMQACRHPSLSFVESESLLATAWVAAAMGQTTRARETALCAAQFARIHRQLAREVVCLQTAVQFGDVNVAGRLTELAELVGGPRAAIAARYAAAFADGEADALAAVSEDLEAMGDRLAAADCAAQASLAYVRSNRRGAALTASGRASRIAESCGATSLTVSAAQSPLTLTAREREIVHLVSQGLSNKAIAEMVTASVRTVEGHIYRVMSRLGVSNRAELSAVVKEHDGVAGHASGAVLSNA